LQSCQTELGLGLLCLLVVGTLLTIAQADPNWVWALIGGFSLGAIAYFAAAAMAWIGEQELRRTLALSRNQKSPGLESVPTRLTQHLNNRG
jgi:cell division protein FtsW (lipid II flippase)